MTHLARSACALTALLALAACGSPPEEAAGDASAPAAAPLEVRAAQASFFPDMGVVHLTVINHTGEDDRLLWAETPAADIVESHETVEEEGVLRMVPRPDGFLVPAGGRLELTAGGKHLMLRDIREPVGVGVLPLILHFEHAGALEVEAEVIEMGGPGMGTSEHMMDEHMMGEHGMGEHGMGEEHAGEGHHP